MVGMEQLTVPDAHDWCTVAYAAERLDVSMRTVIRMVGAGQLTACHPRVGSRESHRHKMMLYTPEVFEVMEARKRLRRQVNA